jgi:hypothetical protein
MYTRSIRLLGSAKLEERIKADTNVQLACIDLSQVFNCGQWSISSASCSLTKSDNQLESILKVICFYFYP